MIEGLSKIKNMGIVVDVGANGGTETMLALNRKKRVVAIECLSDAYVSLRKMFKKQKNVTVLHVCAGSKTEIKTLHLADDSSSLYSQNIANGQELLKYKRKHNTEFDNKETVVVAKLDDLIKEPVAMIKIDVQGYENEVLKGAEFIINKYFPVIVYEDTKEFYKEDTFKLPSSYKCIQKYGRGDKICFNN